MQHVDVPIDDGYESEEEQESSAKDDSSNFETDSDDD